MNKKNKSEIIISFEIKHNNILKLKNEFTLNKFKKNVLNKILGVSKCSKKNIIEYIKKLAE